MIRVLLAACALALTPACSSSPETGPPAGEPFGAGVGAARPLELDELVARADALAGSTVLLRAEVAEVCPKKGCWMTFDTGDVPLRVTFQDYGFFVPKDIAGRTVLVEGRFDAVEVPLDEARHYLEDAGRHAEAAALTSPQRGYALVATGVLLLPADA